MRAKANTACKLAGAGGFYKLVNNLCGAVHSMYLLENFSKVFL